jgi:signal peptidase II
VIVLWFVALAVFALDRWSKALVLGSFFPGESRLVIPRLLWWTYVQNTHGAFGMFGSSPVLLVVLAMVVLTIFAFAFRDAVQKSLLVRVGFGMILGGAVGNIVDRLQHQWSTSSISRRSGPTCSTSPMRRSPSVWGCSSSPHCGARFAADAYGRCR